MADVKRKHNCDRPILKPLGLFISTKSRYIGPVSDGNAEKRLADEGCLTRPLVPAQALISVTPDEETYDEEDAAFCLEMLLRIVMENR